MLKTLSYYAVATASIALAGVVAVAVFFGLSCKSRMAVRQQAPADAFFDSGGVQLMSIFAYHNLLDGEERGVGLGLLMIEWNPELGPAVLYPLARLATKGDSQHQQIAAQAEELLWNAVLYEQRAKQATIPSATGEAVKPFGGIVAVLMALAEEHQGEYAPAELIELLRNLGDPIGELVAERLLLTNKRLKEFEESPGGYPADLWRCVQALKISLASEDLEQLAAAVPVGSLRPAVAIRLSRELLRVAGTEGPSSRHAWLLYWNTLLSYCRMDSGMLASLGDPASPRFNAALAAQLTRAAAAPISVDAFRKAMSAAFLEHKLYEATRPFIDAVILADMLDSAQAKSVE